MAATSHHASFVTHGAHWRVVESDDRLEILPGRANLWAFGTFGMLFLCVVEGLLYLRVPDTAMRVFFMAASVFVVCLFGAIFIAEIRRGAYLICDFGQGTIELPRHRVKESLTVRMTFFVAQYTTEMYDGGATAFELCLRTGNSDEGCTFTIVASLSSKSIDALGKRISDRTGIALARDADRNEPRHQPPAK